MKQGCLVRSLKVTVMASVAFGPATVRSIYLVGDSTATRRGVEWAAVFPTFFDGAKVNVVNAETRSDFARAFPKEHLWDEVTARLRPGDVVLIQIAQGPAISEPRQDDVAQADRWYVRKHLRDARSKGAIPVVLIWPNRDPSSPSGLSPESPDYAAWVGIIAEREQRTSHIDLSAIIAREFEKVGCTESSDMTSMLPFLLAKCVVSGLKSLLDAPVSRYLSPLGLQAMSATEQSFKSPADPNLPTLWIIGDSTVRNGDGVGARGIWGWGDLLSAHLRLDRINVVNRAVSGRSSRTYYTRHWPLLVSRLRPGDFVLMQFGHNDIGAPDNKERARAPLPGIGSESLLIANPITSLPEVVHTYGWYLRKMIGEARAAGVQPIVCTLVPQLSWSADKIVREIFGEWAATVAAEEGAPWIDLNRRVAEHYEQLGEARVAGLFEEPPAHTNLKGAHVTAEIVVESLRAINVLDFALL